MKIESVWNMLENSVAVGVTKRDFNVSEIGLAVSSARRPLALSKSAFCGWMKLMGKT
jgi:hypothetical protein